MVFAALSAFCFFFGLRVSRERATRGSCRACESKGLGVRFGMAGCNKKHMDRSSMKV